MKPAAFKATPQLSAEASRALLKLVGGISLTDKRRAELSALTKAAHQAYARPLTPLVNGR